MRTRYRIWLGDVQKMVPWEEAWHMQVKVPMGTVPNQPDHAWLSLLSVALMSPPDKMAAEQWTGLKDRDGVDMYEGDIVRRWRHRPWSEQYGAAEDYPASIGVVIYVSGWGRFRVAGHRDAPFDKATAGFADYAWTADLHDGHAFWSDQSRIQLQVIGNVHEHRHLLFPST